MSDDKTADKAADKTRPEYGEGFWRGAVRGKYAERYAASVVRLAPDVATSFRDDEAVNEALRIILRVMDDTSRLAEQEDVGQFYRDNDIIET